MVNYMGMKKELFGKTKEGLDVFAYTLKNKNGMELTCLDFGAVIQKLLVPDANQKIEDIVLGYDNVEGYEEDTCGFGAFIGRHANRIGGAKFVINGTEYQLEKNDGENNLHGGTPGYNKVMYEVEYLEDEEAQSIEFSRLSKDMEQGYPGNLDITVTYTLTDDNELVIEYLAVSDKDTLVNLTNHSYFNLSGHKSDTIEDHKMLIQADYFTPTDDALIPTGEIRMVEGTPMDFRSMKRIGDNIDADYLPIKQGNGYDHNFVLNIAQDDVVSFVAQLEDDKSGRIMKVFTNLPGLQVYTANGLSVKKNGKEGMEYGKRAGICFETQFYPNSCNISNFTSCELKAGSEYDYVTVYKFEHK